jgi:hypothetical protein
MVIQDNGCRIEKETYLTSWLFIHLRRFLQRAHLDGWERWALPWKMKLEVELLLQSLTGGHLPRRLKGLDVYMVARRPGSGDARLSDLARDLDSVFLCPTCQGRLSPDEVGEFACRCGLRFVANDRLWSVQRADQQRP